VESKRFSFAPQDQEMIEINNRGADAENHGGE